MSSDTDRDLGVGSTYGDTNDPSAAMNTPPGRSEGRVAMRTDQIHYTLQFDVAEDKMAEFEALADEAIAQTRDEPGTLVYRWQIGGAGPSVQLHERFADEAAMGAHLAAATDVFGRLMGVSEVTRFDVHGDISAESTEALEGFGATIYKTWKGYDL